MSKKKANKTSNLSGMRIQLEQLAHEANKRVSQLSADNYAVREAKRTRPKSRKGSELFKGDLRTRKQIKREYARIMAFMSDWRSTDEGSNFYQAELSNLEKYKGAFGGQWLKKYGETYNTEIIDSEMAEKAFHLYDYLVEEYQSEDRMKMLWNKDSSKITYGSENMIAAIYDMVSKGYDDKDIMDFARIRMESNYIQLQKARQNEQSEQDYGALYDYIDDSTLLKEALDELARKDVF